MKDSTAIINYDDFSIKLKCANPPIRFNNGSARQNCWANRRIP
jgi:hypothetical protein